jgi:hypothetical protein
MIKWLMPSVGWCKLNSDGSYLGNPGAAGSGGLIRDCHGRWIKGYSRSVGRASSVLAELWGVRDGLQLAISLNIDCLEVELDAELLIHLFFSPPSSNHVYSSIINDCRWLMTQIPRCEMHHAYREANRVADALARIGCFQSDAFVLYDYPPAQVDVLLELDVSELTVPRVVPL